MLHTIITILDTADSSDVLEGTFFEKKNEVVDINHDNGSRW